MVALEWEGHQSQWDSSPGKHERVCRLSRRSIRQIGSFKSDDLWSHYSWSLSDLLNLHQVSGETGCQTCSRAAQTWCFFCTSSLVVVSRCHVIALCGTNEHADARLLDEFGLMWGFSLLQVCFCPQVDIISPAMLELFSHSAFLFCHGLLWLTIRLSLQTHPQMHTWAVTCSHTCSLYIISVSVYLPPSLPFATLWSASCNCRVSVFSLLSLVLFVFFCDLSLFTDRYWLLSDDLPGEGCGLAASLLGQVKKAFGQCDMFPVWKLHPSTHQPDLHTSAPTQKHCDECEQLNLQRTPVGFRVSSPLRPLGASTPFQLHYWAEMKGASRERLQRK